MHDFFHVQAMQTVHHLIKYAPDLFFFEGSIRTFSLVYLCLQVTVIAKLHDDAQRTCALLEECLFVTGYVFMLE